MIVAKCCPAKHDKVQLHIQQDNPYMRLTQGKIQKVAGWHHNHKDNGKEKT